MKFRRMVVVIMLAAALAIVPFIFARATHAQDQGGDQGAILSKLDQVLSNQKAIMDQIESLREELNIVKIRVTQAQ